MTDPNTVYKLSYTRLREELGRLPTANELLPLHAEYSRSYSEARDVRLAEERKAAAGRPAQEGFSRQPAPQARTGGEDTRTREAGEALTKPGAGANGPGAASEPDGVRVNPGPADTAIVGTRGPGGGYLAVCVGCESVFERSAGRGRPAIRCQECR